MADQAKTQELESFRKMILELVPLANKIIKAALKPKQTRKKQDGTVNKPKTIPPKSIDLARYVLDQYAKMIIPGSAENEEIHVVDSATLTQMKKAKKIVEELNKFQATRNRITDAELN